VRLSWFSSWRWTISRRGYSARQSAQRAVFGFSARVAYEADVRQTEKYGHGGMTDDLRAALVGLGE